MSNQHTPGPWKALAGDHPGFKTASGEPGIYANARPSDDYFVLKIAELETNVPERERAVNARLIAAAPELLEALKDLLSVCGGGGPVSNRARAVIRKATGVDQ